MRVFDDETALELTGGFLTWVMETHPAVLKQLVDAWKKSKEMKK